MRDRYGLAIVMALLLGCGRGSEAPRPAESVGPAAPPTAPMPPLMSEGLPPAQGQPLAAVKSKHTIVFALDAVRKKGQSAFVEGWGFIDQTQPDARGSEIYVVLEAGGTRHMFPCAKVARDDVGHRYGTTHLVDSGFAAHIPLESLPKGSLAISLYIKAQGREALQFTGKTIET